MLTQRKIFWFWLPLAASWTLMMVQSPVIQAAIARLPEVNTMLAASGIVISLAVTIESPIIMILATTTAFATSPQAYRILRRFVLHLTILLTIIAAVVAFVEPVYQALVPGVMGIPVHIADVAQTGMQIMVFWSAAIGWRRFYQGILIRYDQTRLVGYGTVVRVLAVMTTGFALVSYTDLPGIVVAGFIWMVGVSCELIYIYWVTRPVIKANLQNSKELHHGQLTYREVAKYHTPLAATSLLTLLAQPLIGASLARMAFPDENLAAWPVIFTIWLFFRSWGMALPEVILALFKGPETLSPLRRFSLRVAVGSSLALTVAAFTPVISFYLLYITSVTAELAEFIVPAVIMGLPIPALQAIQNWLRGILMVAKATREIYWGMGISLLATGVVLVAGGYLDAPGAPAAAVALNAGLAAEIIYLWWRVKPAQARLQLVTQGVGG